MVVATLVRLLVALLAWVPGAGLSGAAATAATTTDDTAVCSYDVPAFARVDAHVSAHALAGPAQLTGAREWSASPPVGPLSRSTTPSSRSVATNNPVPGRVSRIVEEDILDRGMTTLGHPSSSDVFATAADDIAGLNSAQIGEHLTLLDGTGAVRKGPFAVIEFDTPGGIASPLNRTNPGFVNGGRAAGGAREFVVPNSPLDQLTNVVIRRPG